MMIAENLEKLKFDFEILSSSEDSMTVVVKVDSGTIEVEVPKNCSWEYFVDELNHKNRLRKLNTIDFYSRMIMVATKEFNNNLI